MGCNKARGKPFVAQPSTCHFARRCFYSTAYTTVVSVATTRALRCQLSTSITTLPSIWALCQPTNRLARSSYNEPPRRTATAPSTCYTPLLYVRPHSPNTRQRPTISSSSVTIRHLRLHGTATSQWRTRRGARRPLPRRRQYRASPLRTRPKRYTLCAALSHSRLRAVSRSCPRLCTNRCPLRRSTRCRRSWRRTSAASTASQSMDVRRATGTAGRRLRVPNAMRWRSCRWTDVRPRRRSTTSGVDSRSPQYEFHKSSSRCRSRLMGTVSRLMD